jgi:RNA polymerase sigma factor (sigma-70 family)
VSLPPFETIVAEHGSAVLRVCRAVLGPQDADDAWSETFLSALKAYPAVRPDSNLRAWLVTIAHRKAIDVWRATQRRPRPVDQVPELTARRPAGSGLTAGASPGPEDTLPDEALGQAVAALPFKQRAAVAYRYLGDLSYADIAQLLGSSEAAARRSAADGIAALRTSYAAGRRPTRPGAVQLHGERNHDHD